MYSSKQTQIDPQAQGALDRAEAIFGTRVVYPERFEEVPVSNIIFFRLLICCRTGPICLYVNTKVQLEK